MNQPPLFRRTIWMLWLQGWSDAPPLVQACASTWEAMNPGWELRCLDERSCRDLLSPEILAVIDRAGISPAAASDLIRVDLLRSFGGVWADATTYCVQALDEWIWEQATHGFFAFALPNANRPVSSWFLASTAGHVLSARWRDRAIAYWESRLEPESYFWLHRLFRDALDQDPEFEAAWSQCSPIDARNSHRYVPYENELRRPWGESDEALITQPDTPVLKLTHKLEGEAPAGSVEAELVRLAEVLLEGRPSCVLAWYGSVPGHGTVGDAFAVQALADHLSRWTCLRVINAWNEVPIAGRSTDSAQDGDVAVFACGPLLDRHPTTTLLESRERTWIGAGVSISEQTGGTSTLFSDVFAREGGPVEWDDLAVLAQALHHGRASESASLVGVALRGHQAEYGEERCNHRSANNLIRKAARRLVDAEWASGIQRLPHRLARIEPQELVRRYEGCSLILTTRWHGFVLASALDIPVVAVDQIADGEKVQNMVSRAGGRVFLSEEMTVDSLTALASELLDDPPRTELAATRLRLKAGAERTLLGVSAAVAGA